MVRLIYARFKHTSCGEMQRSNVQQEFYTVNIPNKKTQSVKIENKMGSVRKKVKIETERERERKIEIRKSSMRFRFDNIFA